MTESERDLLMPFLRNLVNTRITPADDAASKLIRNALRRQPHAGYLLVQRALTLECELAAAQQRVLQLEGKDVPAHEAAPAVADFLNARTSGWGEPVDRNAGLTTSKRLYDFFKQELAAKNTDLESKAVSFIGDHAGRIWLCILGLAIMVVLLT